MKKEESLQKKKTLGNTVLRTGIKVAIVVAVLILVYVFYEKVDFSGASYSPKTGYSKTSTNAPSELKWFNDFKGVENVPSKNGSKQSTSSGSQNFLQYEADKNKK